MNNPLVLAEIARASVFFAHDAVGEDILDGLRVLTAPCKIHWTSRRVGRNGDPIGKIDGFCRAMIEGPGRDASIAIFKLSYADFDENTDVLRVFDHYDRAIRRLHEARPVTRILHSTVPLTRPQREMKAWLRRRIAGDDTVCVENALRHEYSQRIRDAFSGSQEIFDLALAQACGPTTVAAPMLAREMTSDGCRMNALGRERLATELVRTLARVLGFDASHVPEPDGLVHGRSGADPHGIRPGVGHARLGLAGTSSRPLGNRAWVHGGGHVVVGQRVRVEGAAIGVELKVEPGAELVIGDDVVLGSGTSIEVHERIQIGSGCRIGEHCKLLDSHLQLVRGDQSWRPPSPAERPPTRPSTRILVEREVVIEDYAVLLPGARVGAGARIGRGAVVSRAVPEGATVRPRPVHPARTR
jgi:acetyltransferase-like isoleucine patch superfamily enzyme